MNQLAVFIPLLGLVGLGIALTIFRGIVKRPGGEGRVAEIASMIHTGAMVFMRREILLIAGFAVVVGGCLMFKDPWEALAFFLGALCSSVAGFIGMFSATRVNVRTALAANERGAGAAL